MKRFKTFVQEDAGLDDSADILNDDIQELNSRVVNSEDVHGKLDDIASMVNKGRLYSATVPLAILNDIWIKVNEVENLIRFTDIQDG